MPWYELVALFFCLGALLSLAILCVVEELRRGRAYREMLKKQMAFYDVAGEWFFKQNEKEN